MKIELLRAGTFTDSNGTEHSFTEDNLQQIADSYNTGSHEAPLVIGHPEPAAPAYGWIDKLERSGEKLFALAKQVVPAIKSLITDGLYKKVSIALTPDSKLHHVGLLGAQPPAVEGLAPITFSEPEVPYTAIETLLENPTEQEIQENAAQSPFSQIACPDPSGGDTEGRGIQSAVDIPEPNNSAELLSLQSQLAEKESAISSLQAELSQLKAAAAPKDNPVLEDELKSFSAFLTDSVVNGRLTPAQKQLFSKLLSHLQPDNLSTFAQQPGQFFTIARQYIGTQSTNLLKPVNISRPGLPSGSTCTAFDIARSAIAARMR